MSAEAAGQGAGEAAGPEAKGPEPCGPGAPGAASSRAVAALRQGLLWLALGGALLAVARGLHHLSWLQMVALTR